MLDINMAISTVIKHYLIRFKVFQQTLTERWALVVLSLRHGYLPTEKSFLF